MPTPRGVLALQACCPLTREIEYVAKKTRLCQNKYFILLPPQGKEVNYNGERRLTSDKICQRFFEIKHYGNSLRDSPVTSLLLPPAHNQEKIAGKLQNHSRKNIQS